MASPSSAIVSAFRVHAIQPALASKPLEAMFHRVRLNLVEFNAQDVYQLCTTAYNMDTLGMMRDPEFMRGLSAAFQRSDQTVLSPFQASLVTDTFRKANINVSPKEVAIPETDAVSPESLLNVLRGMNITKTRDERKMAEVCKLMFPMLDEFAPSQLSLAIAELSRLKCEEKSFMARLAKRVIQVSDDLSPLDISLITMSLCYIHGIQHAVLVNMFQLVEQRCDQFQPEDFMNVLNAINALGHGKFQKTFAMLVEKGLQHVENMDAVSLTKFLVCFCSTEYRNREHMEIFADALIEVAEDLSERDLVQALLALQKLQLLSQPVFGALAELALRYATRMDPRNIAAVMDVCSGVTFNSDLLMKSLLDRSADLTRTLSPNQLADILDVIALYPPAREHRIVELFGRQSKLRADIMSPPALANTVRALAQLGYVDADFYLSAAETFFRFGFKDFSMLEPILLGLTVSNAQIAPSMAKVLASHCAPMAHSMSLHEVERANRYMVKLGVEDDWVYRKLAARVSNFIKEVTADMPQELQVLMAKGAVDPSRSS